MGQQAKRVLPNSASGLNIDNGAGIKQSKKLRNLFKLNSIKTKLKQTTTVADYLSANVLHENKLDIGQ